MKFCNEKAIQAVANRAIVCLFVFFSIWLKCKFDIHHLCCIFDEITILFICCFFSSLSIRNKKINEWHSVIPGSNSIRHTNENAIFYIFSIWSLLSFVSQLVEHTLQAAYTHQTYCINHKHIDVMYIHMDHQRKILRSNKFSHFCCDCNLCTTVCVCVCVR